MSIAGVGQSFALQRSAMCHIENKSPITFIVKFQMGEANFRDSYFLLLLEFS